MTINKEAKAENAFPLNLHQRRMDNSESRIKSGPSTFDAYGEGSFPLTDQVLSHSTISMSRSANSSRINVSLVSRHVTPAVTPRCISTDEEDWSAPKAKNSSTFQSIPLYARLVLCLVFLCLAILFYVCTSHPSIPPSVQSPYQSQLENFPRDISTILARQVNNWIWLLRLEDPVDFTRFSVWRCWAERLSITNVIVFVNDNQVAEEIRAHNMEVITPADLTLLPSSIEVLPQSWMTFMYYFLQSGYNVYATDVNQIPLALPWPRFNSSHNLQWSLKSNEITKVDVSTLPSDKLIELVNPSSFVLHSNNITIEYVANLLGCFSDTNSNALDDVSDFASTPLRCFLETTIGNHNLLSPFSILHQKSFPGTLSFFHYKTVQLYGYMPVVISISLLKNVNLISRLETWGLMSTLKTNSTDSIRLIEQCAPLPPRVSHFPPNSFESLHLRVRALTFDRPDSLRRLLNSLYAANYKYDPYKGDRVVKSLKISFEVSIDRAAETPSAVSKKTPQELENERNVLIEAQKESFQLGEKFCADVRSPEFITRADANIEFDCNVISQEHHQGLVGQWVNSWNPPDDNSEVLVVLEDDCSVTPAYFPYLFHLLDRYYFHSYDPNMFMVSLQSQHTILGENTEHAYGMRTPQTVLSSYTIIDNSTSSDVPPTEPPQFYRYQLVGTWGSVLFPSHWRQFQSWLNSIHFDYTKGEALLQTPCVPLLLSNNWWSTRRLGVWSQWIVRFAYEYGYYSLYSNHPNRKSVILNHRERGVNFKKTKGDANPALDVIDNDLLTLLYSSSYSVDNLPLFDFHFRQVQNEEIPLLPLRQYLLPPSQINQCLTMAIVKTKLREALAKSGGRSRQARA